MIKTLNIERLWSELEMLATFSEVEPPAVTRVVYTKQDQDARSYLINLAHQAGFNVRVDGVGNTFIRWVGSHEELPAIGTGSHIDAIPNAGMFDGTIGVLGGLEALRSLKESGFEPIRSLEVLLFTSEEPTRFGIGCLGSRLLSGRYKPEHIDTLTDDDGTCVREACKQANFTGDLETVELPPDYYHAFVELHIEQGPLLEKRQRPIGIVTAIAAPATLRVEFVGEGGHAGTVLMPDRRDALLGGAELALFIDKEARSSGSADTVATTGVFKPFPGAVNSIPSRCLLEIDIRDTQEKSRDAVLNSVKCEAEKIAHDRQLQVSIQTLNADPPVTCGDTVLKSIRNAISDLGYTSMEMVSRAYHDSLFMGQKFPTGMIFIPCRNGVSHRPDESITKEDLLAGVTVLAETMRRLSIDG